MYVYKRLLFSCFVFLNNYYEKKFYKFKKNSTQGWVDFEIKTSRG